MNAVDKDLTVSIVVPATNAPPSLERCLVAVEAARGPQDEIIIVDDPLADDNLPLRSPAKIRNLGGRRAHGDIVMFVDADVVVDPEAVARFRQAFADDPSLAAAFGSYDDDPPPGDASRFRNLLHHHVHHEGAGEAQTFWAGLGAIRRDVFLAAGGFDEPRFPRPMLEDVELGLRLTDGGHRIRLMPEAQGRHLKQWSLRGMIYSDFRDRGIPWTRLLIERGEAPATLNLGWRHRLTALAVLATTLSVLRTRRLTTVPAGLAAMGVLNRRFYGVLWRHGGARLTLAGVGLHAIHHLTAIAAVPFGFVAHFRRHGATPKPPPLAPLDDASRVVAHDTSERTESKS